MFLSKSPHIELPYLMSPLYSTCHDHSDYKCMTRLTSCVIASIGIHHWLATDNTVQERRLPWEQSDADVSEVWSWLVGSTSFMSDLGRKSNVRASWFSLKCLHETGHEYANLDQHHFSRPSKTLRAIHTQQTIKLAWTWTLKHSQTCPTLY